jgi:hypothetical protein
LTKPEDSDIVKLQKEIEDLVENIVQGRDIVIPGGG